MSAVVQLSALTRGASYGQELELGDDRESAELFWGATFNLAIADHAASLHFHPWLADECLWYIARGRRVGIWPPPKDLFPGLLSAAAHLISPGYFIALRRSLLAWRRSQSVAGNLTIDCDGEVSEWHGVWWRIGAVSGVKFHRVVPPIEHFAAISIRNVPEVVLGTYHQIYRDALRKVEISDDGTGGF